MTQALNIMKVAHLASQLGESSDSLVALSESMNEHCQPLLLIDPKKPDSSRVVLSPSRELRRVQRALYKTILLRRLAPSLHSYGGIKGRSIVSNASQHIQSVYAFTTDIISFYPSIRPQRVYDLFAGRLGCSPDVARIITRLCTYDHHLALGLITSPFIADQIMTPIDCRIAAACKKAGLVYTRFVDDISVSGPYRLDEKHSGIGNVLDRILRENGFRTKPSKTHYGRTRDIKITKLRIKRGKVDVTSEYIKEIEADIECAARLAAGTEVDRPFYPHNEIMGRIHFVKWVNPGREVDLARRVRRVSWSKAYKRAEETGLMRRKKEIRPC